ncbi:MAG: aa3-type cytochrome c oxidase subunit IV [Variibacter sp.]
MADHSKVQYATADGNDYVEHERTYKMFLGLLKWNIAIIVVILLAMFHFLV